MKNMIRYIHPSIIDGAIDAPASKSYAQRAIAIAALTKGESILRNIDHSDDTDAAISIAKKLGAVISNSGRECSVIGGGVPSDNVLDVCESGLSTRLFTPIAALSDKIMTIVGHGSILKRPVSMMEKPLRDIGVTINSNDGFLPLTTQGPMKGGEVEVDGSISSQFLTGLLVSLPLAQGDSVIHVSDLKSKPYVDMTIDTIRAFGVEIENINYKTFNIKGCQKYKPICYNVEGDWSGASCMLVAGAIAGSVTVSNLNPRSLQADKTIIHALDYAGANVSIEWDRITVSKSQLEAFSFDATDCPDLFPALVALAANCNGQSTILGTDRLKHKESDRAKVLAEIYGKMGIEIDLSYENAMVIVGGKIKGGVEIDSYGDHRIAMSAAVASLMADKKNKITGAEAVGKSYNSFWKDLDSISSKTKKSIYRDEQ